MSVRVRIVDAKNIDVGNVWHKDNISRVKAQGNSVIFIDTFKIMALFFTMQLQWHIYNKGHGIISADDGLSIVQLFLSM